MSQSVKDRVEEWVGLSIIVVIVLLFIGALIYLAGAVFIVAVFVVSALMLAGILVGVVNSIRYLWRTYGR